MSYLQIIVFRNDEADYDERYSNSHGGAAMVWSSLVSKYKSQIYPNMFGPVESRFPTEEWEHLWKAVSDGRVHLKTWESAVNKLFYDNALVHREYLELMAAALELFEEAHGVEGYVCHLSAMGKRLRELAQDETVQAVGLYPMSVSENPWFSWDEEKDESIPYNLSTGTKHWFLEFTEENAN